MLYELKNIREASGISQSEAANRFGVSLYTYRNWEQCKNMPRDNQMIKKIADYFGVSMEALFGYDLIGQGGFSELPEEQSASCAFMPVAVNIIIATNSQGASIDEVSTHIAVPASVKSRHKTAFFVKNEGTAMDRVLPSGCYALIDPMLVDVVNGKIYAVKVNGDPVILRRVRELEHGTILEPDSATDPTHEPMVFKDSDERFRKLAIAGRAVWYSLDPEVDFEE